MQEAYPPAPHPPHTEVSFPPGTLGPLSLHSCVSPTWKETTPLHHLSKFSSCFQAWLFPREDLGATLRGLPSPSFAWPRPFSCEVSEPPPFCPVVLQPGAYFLRVTWASHCATHTGAAHPELLALNLLNLQSSPSVSKGFPYTLAHQQYHSTCARWAPTSLGKRGEGGLQAFLDLLSMNGFILALWPCLHVFPPQTCSRRAAVGFTSGQNLDCFKIILRDFPVHEGIPGLKHAVGGGGPGYPQPHAGVEEWKGLGPSFRTQLAKHLYITPLCLLEVTAAPTSQGCL